MPGTFKVSEFDFIITIVSDGSEPNIDSFIEKETKSKSIKHIKHNVKNDLKTYEGRGELTPNLKLLEKALQTMKSSLKNCFVHFLLTAETAEYLQLGSA